MFYGKIRLDFEKTIKVVKSDYSYPSLTMIGEIGGYVGLFLGVSILQVTEIVNYFCRKCCPKSI